jgi:hypothetical protein
MNFSKKFKVNFRILVVILEDQFAKICVICGKVYYSSNE